MLKTLGEHRWSSCYALGRRSSLVFESWKRIRIAAKSKKVQLESSYWGMQIKQISIIQSVFLGVILLVCVKGVFNLYEAEECDVRQSTWHCSGHRAVPVVGAGVRSMPRGRAFWIGHRFYLSAWRLGVIVDPRAAIHLAGVWKAVDGYGEIWRVENNGTYNKLEREERWPG